VYTTEYIYLNSNKDRPINRKHIYLNSNKDRPIKRKKYIS